MDMSAVKGSDGLIDVKTRTPAKEKIIKAVYNDPAGFGTPAQTLKDAKAKDPSITLKDVKAWFAKNVERKGNLRGMNSFVPQDARQEVQIDLFFITPNQLENQKFRIGMLGINTFTKKMSVVPLMNKESGSITAALLETFQKQGVTYQQ